MKIKWIWCFWWGKESNSSRKNKGEVYLDKALLGSFVWLIKWKKQTKCGVWYKDCFQHWEWSIPEVTTGLAINSVPSKGDETEVLVTCTHMALKSNFSCCTNNMQSCRLSVNHPGAFAKRIFNLSHFHTLTLWSSLFSHVAHSGTQPTSNACSLYKNTLL